MKPKKYTLPINNLPIFEALARGECKRQNLEPNEENISSFIYEFAEEAINHSFTPSEELGQNPVTPRLSESFYKEFDSLFSKDGWIYDKLKGKSVDLKQKIGRFKGGLVNLSMYYLELGYELFPKDFEYGQKDDEETSPEDYKKLLRVEQNRYARLYVSTILTEVIQAVYRKLDSDMFQQVSEKDLWNIEGIVDAEKAYKILKSPQNRKEFIRKVKSSLTIGG